jgi:polyphenol oxidase
VNLLEAVEAVPELAALGIRAFTTTRHIGTFSVASQEPSAFVSERWSALRKALGTDDAPARLATASQVHGKRILLHVPGWTGWLRGDSADGHAVMQRGTAIAVTVADCVPVFVAHESGAIALLHSGWRGTVARIAEEGVGFLVAHGVSAADLHVHLGPAICGSCYEVNADVYAQLTGRRAERPTTVDLRALITEHLRAVGVRHVSTSSRCTRCDNDRFFSHRAGDEGRQVSAMIAPA